MINGNGVDCSDCDTRIGIEMDLRKRVATLEEKGGKMRSALARVQGWETDLTEQRDAAVQRATVLEGAINAKITFHYCKGKLRTLPQLLCSMCQDMTTDFDPKIAIETLVELLVEIDVVPYGQITNGQRAKINDMRSKANLAGDHYAYDCFTSCLRALGVNDE